MPQGTDKANPGTMTDEDFLEFVDEAIAWFNASRSRSIRLPANGWSRCRSSIRRMTERSATETARGL